MTFWFHICIQKAQLFKIKRSGEYMWILGCSQMDFLRGPGLAGQAFQPEVPQTEVHVGETHSWVSVYLTTQS